MATASVPIAKGYLRWSSTPRWSGYQEIVSDPSYTYQGVVMTYPLIGNYGVNDFDDETWHPSIGGLIVGEYNDEPSNFRCSGDAFVQAGACTAFRRFPELIHVSLPAAYEAGAVGSE